MKKLRIIFITLVFPLVACSNLSNSDSVEKNDLKSLEHCFVEFLQDPLSAISMGGSEKGFAISAKEASGLAKPYLYKSYLLRNESSGLTEPEFWENQKLQIYVLLHLDHYLVVRERKAKFLAQYYRNAVRVHKYSGKIEPFEENI